MQLTTSLRWALYYRGLALLSFLVGAAVAAAGVWIGLYDVLVALVDVAAGGGDLGDAMASSRPIVGGALIVLGFAVWQVGKTAAFYKTLTEATESEMADRFDTQTVKSEILSALDDQLSDLHADVETTRRQVSRMSRDEHADELTIDDEAEASASGDDGRTTADSEEERTASGGTDRTAKSGDADRATKSADADRTSTSGSADRATNSDGADRGAETPPDESETHSGGAGTR